MDTKVEFKAGDIFLCDSDKIGARIVKFLMTAPTVWQYLYRAARGKQKKPRYYHAGMILNYEQLIEQQGRVQQDLLQKILSRDVVVYRLKRLDEAKAIKLCIAAQNDVGEGYDLPLIFGKTLTWITGIRWFTDFLGYLSKNEEICVTRVGKWYREICDFGVKDHAELTTLIMDEYCQKNPDWETVYIHEGGDKGGLT